MTGKEIRTIREFLGLTQEEFANLLGVQHSTVNRWENNKAKPQGQSEATLNILRTLVEEAKSRQGNLSANDIKRVMQDFKTGRALNWMSKVLPTSVVGALLFGGAAGLIGGVIASYLLKKPSENKEK